MKVPIWNTTIKSLITSGNYSSVLLGLILVDDYETIAQWWQYSRGPRGLKDPKKIGLTAILYTHDFYKAWTDYSSRIRGARSRKLYSLHLLEQKYEQYKSRL